LLSSPPSSARNVDGARPTNMLGDLPDKKSQLDLKPFGVGVLAVSSTVSPRSRLHVQLGKMSLLEARA